MKVFMDFEEHQAIKEKRSKKMKKKTRGNYGYEDDMELMIKKGKNKKSKGSKSKNKMLKNTLRNLQYDYDEDSYELDYDMDEFK